jgi:hypothetical protein
MFANVFGALYDKSLVLGAVSFNVTKLVYKI